jgi:Skp family chaperone for outer membrane proteins
MKIKITAIAALAASFAVAATAASAAPQPAGAQPVLSGPAIPGFCIFSQSGMLRTSLVGKAVITRLGQLNSQVDAELNAEYTSIQTDGKTLEGQRATMGQDQLQKAAAALGARENAFQQKVQQRKQEMEATENKQFGIIGQQALPIITSVAQQRGCSVLLNDQAALMNSPSMDITPAIVQQLDARIQTLAFDREHLEAQPAAGGGQ